MPSPHTRPINLLLNSETTAWYWSPSTQWSNFLMSPFKVEGVEKNDCLLLQAWYYLSDDSCECSWRTESLYFLSLMISAVRFQSITYKERNRWIFLLLIRGFNCRLVFCRFISRLKASLIIYSADLAAKLINDGFISGRLMPYIPKVSSFYPIGKRRTSVAPSAIEGYKLVRLISLSILPIQHRQTSHRYRRR